MSFSRRYGLALVLPPLLVALPLALLFLAQLAGLERGTFWRLVLAAVAAYVAAAMTAGHFIAVAAREVESDLEAGRNPSRSISRTLNSSTYLSAAVWIGWGLLVSFVAWAILSRSFIGFQYFMEAALIVAAPAMAWSYWAGKRMLLNAAASAEELEYTGRVWSIGAKIAIVFIGFFFVSAGAMMLIIKSRVALKLGPEAAFEVERLGLLITLLTTVVFALATWFLAEDIRRPMGQLIDLAGDLAHGRFGTKVGIFADDEVGVLAQSFGATRKNLRTLIGHIGERGEAVTGGVRRMTEGTEALVGNAQEQSGMAVQSSAALTLVQSDAQSVLQQVERMAELTYDSAGRATELRASFDEVARRMGELFHSVEKSSSAATEIDASARETANRSLELGTIASDVLAFVAQMDATVEQITRTAQSTAALSEEVRRQAANGRVAVDATMEGIRNAQEATQRTAGAFDELQKSLGQIDQILLFIDDVTNRTNLLSLNAAIIAAQAGVNDHGFSVIADEVRELADRTRTATKEIAGIIRALRPITREAVVALEDGVRNVDQTVDLAQNASSALETILGSADRSLEMTLSISRALEEQARGSRHLHTVTTSMSEHIAEMQRATQGQAEATRLLASEAERVSDIASRVNRATGEQTLAAQGIAGAMENVAADVGSIRDRLERQLHQAEQIASASRITLAIAERNNTIAEQFRQSLQTLVSSGREFETEVSRYRS
jgi:methyl-accepting chemotaxis protein